MRRQHYCVWPVLPCTSFAPGAACLCPPLLPFRSLASLLNQPATGQRECPAALLPVFLAALTSTTLLPLHHCLQLEEPGDWWRRLPRPLEQARCGTGSMCACPRPAAPGLALYPSLGFLPTFPAVPPPGWSRWIPNDALPALMVQVSVIHALLFGVVETCEETHMSLPPGIQPAPVHHPGAQLLRYPSLPLLPLAELNTRLAVLRSDTSSWCRRPSWAQMPSSSPSQPLQPCPRSTCAPPRQTDVAAQGRGSCLHGLGQLATSTGNLAHACFQRPHLSYPCCQGQHSSRTPPPLNLTDTTVFSLPLTDPDAGAWLASGSMKQASVTRAGRKTSVRSQQVVRAVQHTTAGAGASKNSSYYPQLQKNSILNSSFP